MEIRGESDFFRISQTGDNAGDLYILNQVVRDLFFSSICRVMVSYGLLEVTNVVICEKQRRKSRKIRQRLSEQESLGESREVLAVKFSTVRISRKEKAIS